jgi:lipopolysaccharide/colanic/teichoic acid biosynthesis glycosyltransferase
LGMGVFTQKRNLGEQKLPFISPAVEPDSNGYLPGILSAEQMKRALSKERRRTDRSSTPFLLMLVDAERAKQLDETRTLLHRVCSCLLACLRETDVCGQYAEPSVLGILFTEINSNSADPIEVVIRARVVAALSSQLDENEMNRLRITTHLYPDKWDRLDTDYRPSTPELYRDLPDQMQERKVQHGLKRTMDVLGSAAALLLLSPLMLLLAVLTKLTSKGPILFKQRRLGQHGTPFVLLKFRTMHNASDPAIHKAFVSQFIRAGSLGDQSQPRDQKVYKITKDPRVTRLGRLLRESSLDELPQFWNVLKGDMSLVGPRPPIAYEVDNYDAWHRRRLLEVKPGITGLWQVCGRSRTEFNDMVRLDLQYAKTWSVWLDLKILFRTPLAVISGNGAH